MAASKPCCLFHAGWVDPRPARDACSTPSDACCWIVQNWPQRQLQLPCAKPSATARHPPRTPRYTCRARPCAPPRTPPGRSRPHSGTRNPNNPVACVATHSQLHQIRSDHSHYVMSGKPTRHSCVWSQHMPASPLCMCLAFAAAQLKPGLLLQHCGGLRTRCSSCANVSHRTCAHSRQGMCALCWAPPCS